MSTAMFGDSTFVTVLTPAGRSAVAVVLVAGTRAEQAVDTYFQAANQQQLKQQTQGRIVYGRWGRGVGEDLVISRRAQNLIEVHCHGGSASIAQVLTDLTATGCQQLTWQQWLEIQTPDKLIQEVHQALAGATTLRAAKILLDQYHGALHCALMAIKLLLSEGAARIASERIASLLAYAELGLHLTRPWQIVIAGQPNVGKSSLINALVGYQRAIVFDQPGTTRDVVTASTAIEGWPVEFSDTAGLHQTTDEIENAGIALARQQLKEADFILWVLDAQQLASAENLSAQVLVQQQMSAVGVQLENSAVLTVVNKTDLVSAAEIDLREVLPISAKQGTGLENLLELIANSLVSEIPSEGAAVPFTERQIGLLQQVSDHCQQEQSEQALKVLAQLTTS